MTKNYEDKNFTHAHATPDEAGKQAQRALDAELVLVRERTAGLHDPELGGIGLAFNRATEATKCPEVAGTNLRHHANAVYTSFDPCLPGNNFVNAITYGDIARIGQGLLFSARCHEYIHVMQYGVAAALHADPHNWVNDDIILTPLAYLTCKERLEAPAYVDQAWLCSLAAPGHHEIRDQMKRSVYPPTTFERLRRSMKGEPLSAVMTEAARRLSKREGYWLPKGPKFPFADNLHAIALDDYAKQIKFRLEAAAKTGKKITFVRLAEKDVEELGQTFGPNIYMKDGKFLQEFLQPSPLSPANQKLLDGLNVLIGNAGEAANPTIDEALAARGATRAAYIKKSRGESLPPALSSGI